MKPKSIIQEYQFLWRNFSQGMPRFLKYQIATKLLFSLLIFPVFWMATQALIQSKGVGAISNSEMLAFILSPQGLIFLLVGGGLLIVAILLEICGFITISSQVLMDRPESSYKELLKSTFKQLPRMMEFGSLILLLYLIVLIPLSGTGVTLSFLKNIRIPNFITSVIEKNVLYSSLYFLLILITLVLSIRWIFTFQFMVIGEKKPSQSMKSSGKLMKANWKDFFKEFLLIALINGVLISLIAFIWGTGIAFVIDSSRFEGSLGRIVLIALVMLQNVILSVGALLLVPFELHHLTLMFYHFVGKVPEFKELEQRVPEIPEKTKPSLIDKVLQWKKTAGVLLLLSILLISIPMGLFFDEIFRNPNQILVVGHRGGGGEDIPENSISSIKKAVENKVDYVEIDVQRTKDGAYIINHDGTFQRVAGDSRTAQEMTLKEIKELDFGSKFPKYKGEKIPTLEEILDYSKGKVGVFIELKGVSADPKMADEVISMVRKKEMENKVIIMSLDYNLIKYVRNKYPKIDTGFVYFLALGDAGSFDSSYIILEEDAATDSTLNNIRTAGKKSVVWTVNTSESMNKFSKKDVDAIITDDVKQMKYTLEANGKKTTGDILLDLFFDK